MRSLLRARMAGFVLFTFVAILAIPGAAYNQTVTIVQKTGDRYHLQIDGKDYLAFTPETIRARLNTTDSLRIELAAAQKRIDADSALVESYEKTIATYRRNFALQDTVMGQVRSLYTGYRDLYFDYKKAYSEPWLYFHGGVGVARERGGDQDALPVVLMGFSIKRLSLLGFINNDQSALLLGLNYPIRFNFSFF